MKKSLTVVALLLLPFLSRSQTEHFTLKATVKNTGQDYVTLNYEPRLRGTLSPEGYQATGAVIDSKGNFKLGSDRIADGAEYYLDFNKKIIRLVLFNDDELKLEADLDNLQGSIFATGKGAGKINVMYLPQFEYKLIDTKLSLNEFVARNDSTVASRLTLLEAIHSKNTLSPAIVSAPNSQKMQRIIKETPLSQKEYDFLKLDIEVQRYLVSDYISATSETASYSNVAINPESQFFNAFRRDDHRKIKNLNHYHFGNAAEQILKFEFIRTKLEANTTLTYKDWNKTIVWEEYSAWIKQYLRDNFTAEVHDSYYTDILNWYATMGIDDASLYQYLKDNAYNKECLNRYDVFKKLLDNGLNDANYDLNKKTMMLDKPAFDALLQKHKGKSVLYVFWSAQFAGASVLNCLPAVAYLEKQYGLIVINICVDRAEHKNLWAARIIDSDWKGSHYFMPVENNADTLEAFGNSNIGSFCSGGAAYILVNKTGDIHKDITRPTELTSTKMASYLK
ncbi:hypothetical protein [Flavobacterium sp.]|uniref:hypothetical protein n=1 Tax=Flavobacterium sp. TaxID=239 RepID=UPI0040337B34